MPDYLTDLHVTESKDIEIDDTNDLRTVSGVHNLEQGVALSTMAITSQMIGGRVSASQLGLLEERVGSYLNQDPHVGRVIDVTAETFNRDNNRVTLRVELVENENFTIELNTGS